MKRMAVIITAMSVMLCSCKSTQKPVMPSESPTPEETKGTVLSETETESSVALYEENDRIYKETLARETLSAFPDMTARTDWYGDYQFVDYVCPYKEYVPDIPEEIGYRKNLLRESVVTLTETEWIFCGPVDRKLVQWENYEYESYTDISKINYENGILNKETAMQVSEWEITERNAGPADGQENCFSNMDFDICDLIGAPMLVFYDESLPEEKTIQSYMVYTGDGVVLQITKSRVAAYQKLR